MKHCEYDELHRQVLTDQRLTLEERKDLLGDLYRFGCQAVAEVRRKYERIKSGRNQHEH